MHRITSQAFINLLFIALLSIISSSNLIASNATNNTPTQSLNYGQTFQHQSKTFNQPRRYMVSLPERYSLSSYRYPTLYVLDGDFQFHHVANTAKHLARMGKIPPMIVVGVAFQGPDDYLLSNTWPIDSEPGYGGSKQFLDYLYQELVPTIDKEYRTNTSKALAGYSLGGLLVLQSYLDNDKPFNAFLAMSPSVWFDDMSLIARFKKALTKRENSERFLNPLFLSLANERGMGVNELVAVLKNNADQHPSKHWSFKHYPNETHYSTALPALYDALTFLTPNYFLDMKDLVNFKNYRGVLNAFAEKKSLWSGYRMDWLQSYTFAKYVFYTEQQAHVYDILKAIKKEFPEWNDGNSNKAANMTVDMIAIDFALMFNRNQQPQQARELLQSLEPEAQGLPKWHYQLSLAFAGLNNLELAKHHHAKAIELAKKHQLESWEIWELEPLKYQ
ncbi:alpha/beta hydrolase [Pleionea litopenaei]|uniref:Alpha/beta hydrolase-fold protein n=1 Tax=Pleionea litopenaei TaxID=3070815 RepID=A0AA51RWE5_9GAMM|nr:alpha/beta hydrolase-fold protein [Pleionea sp. HL-JVS1]WMS88800.1 alpha/beta hydrolase-fold protein [Pleionea sp. HL-JVS1]